MGNRKVQGAEMEAGVGSQISKRRFSALRDSIPTSPGVSENDKLPGWAKRIGELQAEGYKIQDLLELVPNARTMPQIWLDGEHLGGYYELESKLKETE